MCFDSRSKTAFVCKFLYSKLKYVASINFGKWQNPRFTAQCASVVMVLEVSGADWTRVALIPDAISVQLKCRKTLVQGWLGDR